MDALWDVLMFLGSSLCHQLEERSYFLGDLQMPLCARCMGIHLGFFVSLVYLFAGERRYCSKLLEPRELVALGLIMAVFLLDSAVSYLGISESDNLRRTLSGLALGVPIPFFLVPLLNSLLFGKRNPSSPLPRRRDWIALPTLYGLGLLLILPSEGSGTLFYAVSVIGVMGLFMFYSTGISAIVLLGTEHGKHSVRAKACASVCLAAIVLVTMAFLHEALIA